MGADGSNATLIEYWNGAAWSVQPSPDPGPSQNVLYGAAAVSASDAWAVGDYIDADWLPLLLHWNGTAWTQVASPLTSGTSVLFAVSASSATSVWAVGTTYNSTARVYQPLILHWNGTAWTEQPSPAPGGDGSFLKGVTATSASNAWAVGYTETSAGRQALILHWNGTTWAQVPSPDPGASWTELSGVAAASSTSAWAVGDYLASGTLASGTQDILIEHWNGTAWSVQPSPDPGAAPREELLGVAASSASNAWAVGSYKSTTSTQTVVEHWNGTAWTKVPSPNPGGTGGSSGLGAVAARGSHADAIGAYSTATGVVGTITVRL